MNIDLTNKNSLICGGTSGIGLATAKILAESGCSVVILSRNRARLSQTLKILKKTEKQNHKMIVADLSKPEQILKIFNDYFKANPVDILLNCSSGPLPKNILQCKINDFQTVFNQHFLSVHIITKKAIEGMKEKKYGRIINVLGTSINEPIPDFGLSSIKAATANWTKILSQEVGKYNITVNNILPGPTDTNELKKIITLLAKKQKISKEELLKRVSADTSVGRIAKPEEIANMILFVASEYSSYISGTNISVDGGYTKSI